MRFATMDGNMATDTPLTFENVSTKQNPLLLAREHMMYKIGKCEFYINSF